MPVLNPFLRALFQSSVLGHALSSQNYVLLVPITESLLNGRDRENGKRYSELVDDEDFLGAHILRISAPEPGSKETNIRDNRNKAKSYSTVNSRTVIVKENLVYTNKGFKNLTQAQILGDTLYYSPVNEIQQWLIFYISKPLTGSYEKLTIPIALLNNVAKSDEPTSSANDRSLQPTKKDIQSFNDLLNNFPMIARQMQPGLERLFNEFGKELGKPLPPPPSVNSTDSTKVSDTESIKSNGSVRLPFNNAAYFDDEEDLMRRALETAVTAAIDLFQGVDKQQLSFLGATTDLTGPAVERLIERYVAESVHDSLLFPRLCAFHRAPDHDLDRRIKQMECIDASQVGIVVEDGRHGKRELLSRISRGVQVFRKMGVAGSPQQMLEILLETQKIVSEPSETSSTATDAEKRAASLTINADVLVSLLLLVVIRSQVRHLQARLSYMQRFIYIDDVDSGEIGYALSTLEAVLTYLSVDSGGLRKASKQNQVLWDAVKSGNVNEIRAIFEGSNDPVIIDDPIGESARRPTLSRTTTRSSLSKQELVDSGPGGNGNLSHVFPFQASEAGASNTKRKKRVHMDARSMSVSSTVSLLSRTVTLESTLSGIEGDISISSLAQTQDPAGSSILMIAVENQQPASLSYLLSLKDHYPLETIMSDTTTEGTTLLSAAIQLASTDLVTILLDYVLENTDDDQLIAYISTPDLRGRTAAHYVFNVPSLIKKLASIIPWRQQDKIGHTPLFAVCRTYDHAEYNTMVSEALVAAKESQGDGLPLRLDDHTDFKGNTLLHIINDPTIMHRALQHCDSNPNAMNEKKFTPLMLASKYGRVDMVRIFFGDPRIDLHLREARGLTAVELAKDDEVRNRIDDLTLFSDTSSSRIPDSTGRLTSIVRSYFVEDGSTRYIVKSGAPNAAVSSTTYTITTSRRSVQDFTNLAKWLSLEHPASYMPNIGSPGFRSPFQLHSKPSRAILYDHQLQLDRFLKILIAHPTFATHEMLWEFFLVPDMQPEQVELRAKMKAESLRETIVDDYEPMFQKADLDDVDSVLTHSREMVRKVNTSTRGLIRKGRIYAHAMTDVGEAMSIASALISTLAPPSVTLPSAHTDAFAKLASLTQNDVATLPLTSYTGALSSFQTTISAIQTGLQRPSSLINQIKTSQKQLERHRAALVSNSLPRKGLMNIQLLGMEESRLKSMRDSERGIIECEVEIDRRGKELRYTQEVIVGELAGWTTWREEFGRQEIKRLAKMSVIREKERLRSMQRVLRNLKAFKDLP